MASKHIHKYHRTLLGTNKVWRCADRTCTHHMPHHMSSFVEGRAAICWECNKEMTLHPLNMNEDRPRCDDCRLGLSDTESDIPLSDVMRARLSRDSELKTEAESEDETARIRPSQKSISDFIKGIN